MEYGLTDVTIFLDWLNSHFAADMRNLKQSIRKPFIAAYDTKSFEIVNMETHNVTFNVHFPMQYNRKSGDENIQLSFLY